MILANIAVTVLTFLVGSCQTISPKQKKIWEAIKPESLALSPLVQKFYDSYDEGQLNVNKEICGVAGVHGFQKREGILPYEYSAKYYAGAISYFINGWHENRHKDKQMVPYFPHHSCVSIISHRYKFIYIGIPKTGFKTTTWFFRFHVCNGSFEVGCFEKLILSNMTKEEYTRYYNEYFKFTFVRNPYNRAASAYFMMSKGFMLDDAGNKCAPPFFQHCQDPYKLKELCNKHYKEIRTNNLTSDCCCYPLENTRSQGFLDQHLMPQSPCIFDRHGKITVDFIGRIEFYQQDFNVILQEINKRSKNKINIPQSVKPIGIRQGFDAKNDTCDYIPQMYLDLYRKYPDCLNSIRKHYYIDFKLFQFNFNNTQQ